MAALSRLLGCNVYVSEGRNLQVITALQRLCQRRAHVVLANTFIDEPYNRTGLTLAAASIPELAATVLAVAQAALAALDLAQHAADHPRLGVLDHVSLHPLGPDASLQHAAEAAAALGQALAAPPLRLPVYFYGAAHPAGRRLAEVRRNLGYFKAARQSRSSSSSSSSSQHQQPSWRGSIAQLDLATYPPDAGPLQAAPASGVVTVGAVPWVVNYNVPLHTDDMAAARAVARAVSTRGGGLPGVEAMALPHGDGVIEVATNLVELDWRRLGDYGAEAATASSSSSSSSGGGCDSELRGAGPAEVAVAVAAAAAAHGLPPPGRGYITNKLPQQLIALAAQQLGTGG